MTDNTFNISPVSLRVFSIYNFTDIITEDFNPFDDNGNDTDGTSYLVDAEDLYYRTDLPDNCLATIPTVDGYRLTGYNWLMAGAFEASNITHWIGNDIQKTAYFIANDQKLAELTTALQGGV